MDRYQRVEKPKTEAPINENEIRITTQGRMRNYIAYATSLFQEKGSNEIALKAMGRAINKTVTIAELIKRRIVGLHQNTSIGSIDIIDMWEPLEEGLLPLETTRHVSVITITLSKKELDMSSIGYQPPIPADQVKPWTEFDYEGEASPGMRIRGRGGQGRSGGNNNGVVEYGDGGWGGGRGYGGRGRGRGGRGRSFRGRGREYGGEDMHHESVGYNGYGGSQAAPAPGRGNNNVVDYGDGGWDGGRGYGGRGRGRGRSFRGRGRGYGGEDMHQESGGYNGYGGSQALPAPGRGNNNGMVEYGDGGWDGGRGYGGRGRGRGRSFRGRERGYGGEDMHQESGGYNGYGGSQEPPAQGRGNNNGMVEYGDGGWDGGHGYGGRGRGRGRSFRGRGRGYGGEDMHQESGGYNGYGGSQESPAQGRGNNNGMVEYGDGGWDGGRGYGGRGRGGRSFRGRERGYGGEDMYQESGGYNGYGGSQEPPAQGRGRGRGRRGRGRGGQDFRYDGPVQTAA